MEFLDRHTDLVREGIRRGVRISRMKALRSSAAPSCGPIRPPSAVAPDISEALKAKRSCRPKHHNRLQYSYRAPSTGPGVHHRKRSRAGPSDFSCNNGRRVEEMAAAGCGLAFPANIHHSTHSRAVERQARNLPHGVFALKRSGLYAVYPSTRELIGEGAGFIDLMVERFGYTFWYRAIFNI